MSKLKNGEFGTWNWKLEAPSVWPLWGGLRAAVFKSRGRVVRWTTGMLAAVAGLAAAYPAFAQGCALCYNTAAAENSRGIAALRHGILILMIPPVMIFGTVCFFTVRGRDRFNDQAEEELER